MDMQATLTKPAPSAGTRKVIDQALLDAIDKVEFSPRAIALRDQFYSSKPGLAAERTAIGMRSWQQTEGEWVDLRWAKMVKAWLEGCPTTIFKGQRIAGSLTKYFRGAYPHPENDGNYLTPLLTVKGESTMGGPVEKGTITEEDWEILVEAARFWHGKTLTEKSTEAIRMLFGHWDDDYQKNGHEQVEAGQGWAEINGDAWDRVINEGLRGYVEQLKTRIARFSENMEDDLEKLHFWQGALMSVEAVITFAHRYAQQARDLAVRETDPAWRAELEEIARICDWVPENPARTFREGLQSIVMLHTALGVSNPLVPPFTWGRTDRYLYPLFKKDIAEGRLTVEEAVDLANDLFMYASRLEVHVAVSWQDFQQKGVYSSMGIGGTDEEGNDVTNELSYLLAHCLGLTKCAGVNMVIGWHKGMPSWFMEKATEAAWRCGGGMPQWQNIDHAIELMLKNGVSLKNARNWTSHGCSQINPADSPLILMNTIYNVPLCMDMVLHNGVASLTGMRLGPETGDPRSFKTFDELYAAFEKQTEHLLRKQSWYTRVIDRTRAMVYRQPLVSVFSSGCIENGKDLNAGGCFSYSMQYAKDRGLIPCADSLVAIKKLVYDEKKVTMDELIDALDHNFEDSEDGVAPNSMREFAHDAGATKAKSRRQDIRRMCLEAPKYGNDLGYPEELLCKIGKYTAGIIESEKNVFGYPYVSIRNGQGWHWQSGKALAALPNGRKAREPLPDGSLSAMQGMDRNGPTALLNSALNADFSEPMAAILTPKLPAALLKTKELRHKLTGMTEAYMSGGGTYVQYNILDANVLRQAKRTPEKFRDLIVRVGGYSAYFVALSPEIQDEIIARTEHTL